MAYGLLKSAIDIVIGDGRGQVVLDAKNAGPLLNLKLPPGDYTLCRGVENVKETTIGQKRPTEINLIWPTFDS
jgi:hypothetical protein